MNETKTARTPLIIALLAAPLMAQATTTASAVPVPENLETLGHIKATLADKPHEWVTIEGEMDGVTGASANWTRMDAGGVIGGVPSSEELAASMGVDLDSLSPQERQMIERLQQQQRAAMQGISSGIDVTIQGHQPGDAPSFTENVLVLSPQSQGFNEDKWKAMQNAPMQTEIMYVVESNGMMPSVFYTTDESMNAAGEITFDELKFGTPHGQASGTFQGRICRVEMPSIRERQTFADDCMEIEGDFDTQLFAETL